MTTQDKRVWAVIAGVILLMLLFIPFSSAVLGVTYSYTLQVVAVGGALLGAVAGVLGCFAVLRQESLMGDALSHAALPGVAIAFLVAGRELSVLLIGAGIAAWLGTQVITAILNTTRLKQDTAMAIILASWFAFGITLLTYIQGRPDASQAGLDKFIFGQAAAMIQRDVEMLAVVGLGLFAVIAAFWKEFKLVTFDLEFAHANGFRVRLINTLLTTLIVIAIVMGLQLAGVILMVGLLIAPATAARQWTYKLGQMVILAGLFGAFSGGAGAILSAVEVGLPTGPLIIVVASVLVFFSIAFAPERGIVWTLWAQRQDRRRFAAQNVLRDLHRYALGHGDDPCYPVPVSFLEGVRGAEVQLGIETLLKQGLVKRDATHYHLTPEGAYRAQHALRNHQLWEAYRQYAEMLGLPGVTEDRQQDIRALLPPDAINQLEQLVPQTTGG